jgi:alanine racemase
VTGARIEIDLDAFRANVRLLSDLVTPARTMLAVKANAYGHGLVPLARAALESGADSLAVLEIPAGLALRRAGVTAPLFAWLLGRDSDYATAIEADIDLGVSSVGQLDAISAAYRGKPARVHLKVDTGLHRNGASPEDWPALVSAAIEAEKAGRVVVAALWSHLADASPEDDEVAFEEFRTAAGVAARLGCTPHLLHIAASSAGIRMPRARLGLVRFGIAAYGISPFDDESGAELGLRPVMAIRAPVIAVIDGVASIAVGSADGIQVPAIGEASVAIRGKRYPILELDIDSLTIDVSRSSVSAGDEVTIFGAGDSGEATAEEWAEWGGTIGDEIVARASERLPRVYLEAAGLEA